VRSTMSHQPPPYSPRRPWQRTSPRLRAQSQQNQYNVEVDDVSSPAAPLSEEDNLPETLISPENTPAEAADACETPPEPRPRPPDAVEDAQAAVGGKSAPIPNNAGPFRSVVLAPFSPRRPPRREREKEI
jgi:hypothetical protein